MSITYQDKYQVVTASSIKSKTAHLVVNRVNKSDDGYAQDNSYFSLSANTLAKMIHLVDCFLEPTAVWEFDS